MIAKNIVKKCNDLARAFYKMQGYQVSSGFKFWRAHHPQEAGAWNMAKVACEHLRNFDVDAALTEIGEEQIDPAAERKRLMTQRSNLT